MKKTNRQLVFGSLQPFLFCVGMYCVVLIFSVFICSSVYRAFNPKKYPAMTEKAQQSAAPVGTTAMVTAIK
jgi:hypothetical protein